MKLRSVFASLFLLASVFTYAQTADEVVSKSIEALGGLEKWKSFTTSKATATMSMQGFEFPATLINAAPNKMRVDVSVMGQNIVQAYDGTTAWMLNPLQGGADAQVMPDEAAAEMKSQEFQNPLIDYAAKGHKAELDGKETVEGTNCHKVKLTKKDGTVEYYLIDAESFAPIMMRTAVKSGPGAGQFVETFMSDYQEVDGVMVPFFVEAKLAGNSMQKVVVKEMKFNVPVEDSLFAFPKK